MNTAASMTRYILTSPTGNLGSRVLASLLTYKLIAPSDIIIATSGPDTSRIPASARDADIEIRTNVDFTKSPDEVASGYEGGDVLFLSSYPSPSVERWQYHRNAIDAAIIAGVQTVIYTSLMFGGESGLNSVAGVQQAHIKTIAYLEEAKKRCKQEGKSFDFIVVREGIYAESWWLYAGYQPKALTKKVLEQKVKEGNGKWEWVIPNDGKVAWVGWDDLGEGTARIIANHKQYIGQTLRLTGPRATGISEVAKVASDETGVEVDVKCIGKDAAKDWHLARKSAGEGGDWVVESWVGWFEGLKDGECAVVDPLLENLIGRKPQGIEELRTELFSTSD